MVVDRLNFINGLEAMLFDTELKETFKERSQLHRILVDNTWIFGEEFALTVDDQSLTQVLRAHAKAKKLNILIDEPVKRPGGRRGIVDLMLSRRVPTNREEELSHLVVETVSITRPEVASSKATDQIKSLRVCGPGRPTISSVRKRNGRSGWWSTIWMRMCEQKCTIHERETGRTVVGIA